MAEFAAALMARDIETALALLTDDVVLFYSNGSAIVGKDAFASVMAASWKVVSNYKYSTLASVWLTETDDVAAAIYSFAWSGMAGENEVKGGGRGTRVFCRETSGGPFRKRSQWLIAHEHLSAGQWMP
jgi:ketosteroid isomerase-like protein